MSLLVYKMMVLPNLPVHLIKRIEELITKFLWNGNKPKIKMSSLQLKKAEGGLGLCNIAKREISLKVTWIQIITTNEKVANYAYHFIQPTLRQWIFDCNLAKHDVQYLKITSQFWEDFMKAWSKL